PVFYIAASRTRPATRRELLAKKLTALDTNARTAIWNDALNAAGANVNGHSAAVAEQFPFGQDMIARTVCAASARAQMRGGGADIAEEDVWEACREQASWDLRQLAQQIEPAFTWDDIVLPADVLSPLHEIAAQVAQRAKVYRQWGFGVRAGRGLGISALF